MIISTEAAAVSELGTGPYRCMPSAELAEGDFCIRAVQPEHIEPIRRWRNAQLDLLRQSAPITPDQQHRYYEDHIWPDKATEEPKNILVVYLDRDELIGYGGLVHIAWEHRRAEVSFLLKPRHEKFPEQRACYFVTFLGLMKILAFRDLKLNRLFTETFANRTRHIEALESAGFRLEGRLREHVRVKHCPVDCLFHGCLVTDQE